MKPFGLIGYLYGFVSQALELPAFPRASMVDFAAATVLLQVNAGLPSRLSEKTKGSLGPSERPPSVKHASADDESSCCEVPRRSRGWALGCDRS